MKLGIWGHSIAIRTNAAQRQQHNPELETWPGWIEILESEGYDCVNTGVYHMSTERAAYEIPRAWERGLIDCAVVFWAVGHYYWFPEVPARDFSYYPPSERREKIQGARGIRSGTDFDGEAVAGTDINLRDLVQANMLFQEFHNKEALVWRHENALLRLETQAQARRIPIVHYFHPGTKIPPWLEIISGPVDFGEIGSMQDQAPYSAHFKNCDNRLNRAGNVLMSQYVKRAVTEVTRDWYLTPVEQRRESYRNQLASYQEIESRVWKRMDLNLHATVKEQRKRHNKGAGARPSNPALSAKELKRRAKAAKRQ